jgi:hypothetical protein
MKRLLTILLALTLFAPTIMCGCAHGAQASMQPATPYHGTSHNTDNDGDRDCHHHNGHCALSQDCQNTAIQTLAQIAVNGPDLLQTIPVHFAFLNQDTRPAFNLAYLQNSHAPPPWDGTDLTRKPIFLTTQRLRI